MQRTIDWIRTRGVKYWPAPFLPFAGGLFQQALVGFGLHVHAERVHSVSSMRSMSFLRFTGLLKRDCAPE